MAECPRRGAEAAEFGESAKFLFRELSVDSSYFANYNGRECR